WSAGGSGGADRSAGAGSTSTASSGSCTADVSANVEPSSARSCGDGERGVTSLGGSSAGGGGCPVSPRRIRRRRRSMLMSGSVEDVQGRRRAVPAERRGRRGERAGAHFPDPAGGRERSQGRVAQVRRAQVRHVAGEVGRIGGGLAGRARGVGGEAPAPGVLRQQRVRYVQHDVDGGGVAAGGQRGRQVG